MELLLDQGLPRTSVSHLQKLGISATHVGDVGLADASDAQILDFARRERQVVVTLDADFHALLALSGAASPSVIRIRIEGLRADGLTQLLRNVLQACTDHLEHGAMVTVTESGIRIRELPLVR